MARKATSQNVERKPKRGFVKSLAKSGWMGCKLRSPVRWAAHNCCLSWLLGNLFSERWNNFCRCKQKAKWNKYIFKSRLYIQYIYLISIKCSFLNAEYHLDLQLKKESNKCCWLVPQMYNQYACMCNTWTTCHRMHRNAQECTTLFFAWSGCN